MYFIDAKFKTIKFETIIKTKTIMNEKSLSPDH